MVRNSLRDPVSPNADGTRGQGTVPRNGIGGSGVVCCNVLFQQLSAKLLVANHVAQTQTHQRKAVPDGLILRIQVKRPGQIHSRLFPILLFGTGPSATSVEIEPGETEETYIILGLGGWRLNAVKH